MSWYLQMVFRYEEGTEAIDIIRKEGLSIPVRALVLIIDNLVLAPP